MFLIYNLLSLLILLLYFPILLLKKGPENRTLYVRERLGISGYSRADVWVHAVSVGEVTAALPFLKTLKKNFPEAKVLLSTTTYTGQKIARERFPEADRIMYMPWDTPLTVSRAVNTVRPRIFVMMETEIWPAITGILRKAGSKTVLLNGRISLVSFRGYRRVRPFIKRVLSRMDFFYMQSETDAGRIIAIGAEKEKVGVMGNLKFDIELDIKSPPLWMENIAGEIFVAGSTHEGEEDIILDAYGLVKKDYSDLKLILAPRHPERFNKVEGILKRRGLDFIRRSHIAVNGLRVQASGNLPDIILLDTIGELSLIFSKAVVAFIGGSLLPFGGHNILEPSYWGTAVVFGPHMENFPVAGDFLKAGAAISVSNSAELAGTVKALLADRERALQIGRMAKVIVQSNTGAVKRAVLLVGGLLGNI